MSIVLTTCQHDLTEIDGERVCRNCATVLGYAEIESVGDWKSHNVGLFGNANLFGLASKVAKNLHLPSYAIHTIIQVSSKLRKMKLSKKQVIIFATVYSCRIHHIPRLLGDIFYELEKILGKKIRRSEKTLLKLLNRITKKINNPELFINAPNKEYYLQAYLAKIQDTIINEAGEKHFELIKYRAFRQIKQLKSDPSTAAKDAILLNTSRILRTKIRKALT